MDLAGHTAGNRLALFGAKAAPIQATYLGYYGTTGLPQMDYWITDSVLHPPENDIIDPAAKERWRLGSLLCELSAPTNRTRVQAPPCLKTKTITLGSFNQSRKITPRTASHWMAVLNTIPNSKLLLKSKNLGEQVERERVANLFQEMGLTPERLELRGHSPSLEEHLAAYNDVDIALDTFPYTGCTTTADALWMGVPVLTVAGNSMVSRQAAAVLQGVGCDEWICRDETELVEKALYLANDHNYLQQLRLEQRQKVTNSELLDHAGLATSLEQAFRSWWMRWLKEQGWASDDQRKRLATNQDMIQKATIIPVTNSTCKKIPLWLGSLSDAEYQR